MCISRKTLVPIFGLVGLVTCAGLTGCLTGKKRSDGGAAGDGGACEDACTPGEGQCVQDYIRFCIKDPTGCPRWTAPQPCPPTQPFCSNARCEAVCDDECSERGKQRCITGGHQICGQYDSDKCLEWGPVLACGDGELCWPATGECLRDCDGQPCSCDPGETEQCANVGTCVDGVRQCISGKFGPCEWQVGPTAEVCDGKDNDCNSTNDDPSQLVAEGCEKQQGVCKGAVKDCGGTSGWLPCGDAQYTAAAQSQSKTYESTESLCDGEDNDCNGEVDEADACCKPDCVEKACGADDGCGHPCKEGSCGAGEHCVEGICECLPDCSGKDCGADDTCGGQCNGPCPAGATCQAGSCVCDYVECAGSCCAAAEACKDETTCCLPDCGARVCGPDPVCGADVCGSCKASDFCFTDNGVCGQWTLSHQVTGTLNAVWGMASGIWVVGDAGLVLRYDGTWQTLTTPLTQNLRGVWASANNDVWVVGDGGLTAHFDGTSWTQQTPTTERLNAVWSVATEVWAVGENGTVLLRSSSAWSAVTLPHPVGHLNGVWANSPTNVWVVGDGAVILHFDGSWTDGATTATADLNAVYGLSSEVWAVGDGGTVLRHVGSDWTAATSNTTQDLYGVTSAAKDDAWAVGAGGEALHLDAAGWSVVPSNTTSKLNAVWTDAATRGWAVGEQGVILELGIVP